MKMVKDVDISKCNFFVDVVPYMYGEMSPAGISAFESHLLECDECTDELAAVSFARYEVYDWKKLEFDPLPTPRLLPFQDPVAVQAGVSWFDGLRAAFGGWLIPSSAFAAVAIAVIAGAVFYSYDSNSPVLGQAEVPSPTVSQPISPPTGPTVAVTAPVNEVRKDEPAVIRTVVTKRSSQIRPVRVVKTTNAPRSVPTVATKVPRLNEFSDDEDTSLRLAMLFEDLDTRD